MLKSKKKRSRKDDFYLSQLPIYNTSSVLVFNENGEIYFKNKIAEKNLKNIKSINDFEILDILKLIQENQNKTLVYYYNNKIFQVDLKGSSKDKVIYAYLVDITEVMKLSEELEVSQREIIYTLGEIGETRSKETGFHVKRVALYSELLAKLYGLTTKESEYIKIASPMHDIGKIGIPDKILNKPGKHTFEEFEIMKTHSEIGYKMLKSSKIKILKLSAIIAYEHHEKYDGTGYPRGLSATNIDINARITTVADVFDALGSDRVYKKAWKLGKILNLFKEERGKHFDPDLVDLFLDNLNDFLSIRDQYKEIDT